MASVNYLKIKCSADAKAMLRHCENEERLQHEHSNKDIDKSKTYLNKQLRSYDDSCSFYDNRIKGLDNNGNKNKRKDRVTMFGLDIPVPEHLNRNEYSEWFDEVNSIVAEMYGGDDAANIVGMYQHYDEEHTYIDAETKQKRVSRVHEHIYIIPEHDGRLNGKWFSSKANMLKVNNAIDKMTMQEYGISFMDGSKKKSMSDVATLKNKSLKAENNMLEQQNAKLIQKAYDMNKDFTERELKFKQRDDALKARESDLDVREANLSLKEQKCDTETATAIKMQQELNDRETNLKDLEDKYLYGLSVLSEMPSPQDDLVKFTKKATHNGVSLYDMFEDKRKKKADGIRRKLPNVSDTPSQNLDDDCQRN